MHRQTPDSIFSQFRMILPSPMFLLVVQLITKFMRFCENSTAGFQTCIRRIVLLISHGFGPSIGASANLSYPQPPHYDLKQQQQQRITTATMTTTMGVWVRETSPGTFLFFFRTYITPLTYITYSSYRNHAAITS